MKIVNTTAVAPGLEKVLERYSAPDWLVYLLGSILVLAFAYAAVCRKFSEGSTVCHTGSRACCATCTGCLSAGSENCTLCTQGYKNCVVNTYDCLTFAPRYIRAQRALDARMEEIIRSPPRRQMPVLKIGGPDPFNI